MAKKKDEFDFDDDFNFGALDDMGEAGFNGKPIKDDRKPVSKVAGSFVTGAKMKWKENGFRKQLLKNALPSGYGMALDELDKTGSSMRSLYNESAKQARPAMRDMRNAFRKAAPGTGKYVPKALADKLNAFVDAESGKGSQIDPDESQITLALGTIFAQQAEQTAKKEQYDEVKETVDKSIDKQRFETTAELLAGIRHGTNRLATYQDNVTVQYQKKNLEISMRQYFTQRKLLESFQMFSEKALLQYDAISKNTGLPEFVKIKQSEVAKQQMRESFIGGLTQEPREFLSGLTSNVGKRARGKVKDYVTQYADIIQQAAFGLEMMADAVGGEQIDFKELAGNMIGGELLAKATNFGASKVRSKLEKHDKIMTGSNVLTYGVQNKTGLMSNFLNSNKGGRAGNFIRDIVGSGYKRDNNLRGGMMDSLDEAAHFNIQTRKAITDVIPGWLAKVHQELKIIRTGNMELQAETFDWETGGFVEQKEIAKRVGAKLFDKSKMDNMRERINGIMEAVDPNGELKGDRIELEKFMLKKISNGVTFDPTDYVNSDFYEGVKWDTADRFADHFSRAFGYDRSKKKWKPTRGGSSQLLRISKESNALMDDLPDPKEELLKYAKTGQLDALMSLGIIEKNGGSYSVDYQAYADALRTGIIPTGVDLPGLGGSSGNFFPPNAGPQRPNAGGGAAAAYAQKYNPNASANAAMQAPDVQTQFEKIGDRIIDAIMNNCSKEEVQESNLWLEEIYNKLLNGILVADMVQMAGASDGVKKGLFDMTLGEIGRSAKRKAGTALTKTKSFVSKKFQQSKVLGKKMFDIGNTVVGKAVKFGVETFEKIKDRANDVYVKGRNSPVLLAKFIRAGEYYDQASGKVIKNIHEIRGAVVNKAGEVILTAEEYAAGLYDEKGKPLKDKARGILEALQKGIKGKLKASAGMIGKGARFAYDLILDSKDIYVKGEDTPRLYVNLMRNGFYHDEGTLKTIYRFEDIGGPVLDNDGNVILSAEDIKKGLVDREGLPIEGLSQKLNRYFTMGVKQVKRNLRIAKVIGKKAWKNIKGFFGGLKNGILGEGFQFAMWAENRDEKIVESLEKIYTLLNERIPDRKKKNKFDTDGDGFREGSWQSRRAKKRAEAEGDQLDKDLKGKQGDEKEPKEGFSIMDMLGKGGAMLSGAKDLAMGAAGALGLGKLKSKFFGPKGPKPKGSLMSRAAKGLGKGAWDATKFLGKNLGRAALWGGKQLLFRAAPAILTGLASVLSAPVVLGAAAIALTAYGGYKLYKHLNKSNAHLSRLRIIQYGIDVENESQVNMISALENILLPDVVFPSTGGARLDSKANPEEVLKIFGISTEDEDELKKWSQWYMLRFKPVFLTHLTVLYSITKDKQIFKVDEVLQGDDKKDFVARVSMKDLGQNPFNIMSSPFKDEDELDYDSGDVEDEYEDIVEAVNELAAKETKAKPDKQRAKEKAGSMLTAEQKKAEDAKAKALALKEKQNSWGERTKRFMNKAWEVTGAMAAGAVDMGKKTYAAARSGMSSAIEGGANLLNKGAAVAGAIGAGVVGAVKSLKGWVMPAIGRVSSQFGTRVHPITGKQGMHNGIDIAAPNGTPIMAAAAGVIIRREYSESYGNVIYIRHEDEKVTRYAHMSRFEEGLKVGDAVGAGQVIGYVGNTGRSAGNHLHFEIRQNAKSDAAAIDPLSIIKDQTATAAQKQLKDDQKAAKPGADATAYEKKPEDNMEGMDTVKSTETGKGAQQAAKPEMAAKGVDPNAQNDKVAAAAASEAKSTASQVTAQKSYQQQLTQQGMDGIANILRESLKTQQSMNDKMTTVAAALLKIQENTSSLNSMSDKGKAPSTPGGTQKQQRELETAATRKAPIKMGNSY